MTVKSTRVTMALIGLLILAVPAFAQRGGHGRYYAGREDAFRIHLGDFRPDGNSDYWRDKEADFTGSIDDFENASFGLDYLLPLGDRLNLVFSGSVFEGDSTNSYRDFVDNRGDRIRHDTTLDIGSVTAGLIFHFAGPDAPVIPYIGA